MKQQIQKSFVSGRGSHESVYIRGTVLFETAVLVAVADDCILTRLSNNMLGKMSRFIFPLLGYVKSSIKRVKFIIPLRSQRYYVGELCGVAQKTGISIKFSTIADH